MRRNTKIFRQKGHIVEIYMVYVCSLDVVTMAITMFQAWLFDGKKSHKSKSCDLYFFSLTLSVCVIATVFNFSGGINYCNMQLFFILVDTACILLEMLPLFTSDPLVDNYFVNPKNIRLLLVYLVIQLLIMGYVIAIDATYVYSGSTVA